MQEVWKPVKGFEKYFKISNLGRLKRKDRILKATNDRGYLKINLSVNGKRYLRYIHRLVAEAFIPNPNNFKEVNHLDNNPSNNNKNNLEWCDRKYNLDYMIKHQNDIKERHEKRIEILENIFYGIELGYINNINQIKDLIDESLLNEY